ncbi:neuroligin-1-like isoform X2 [Chelonus insularis]|uniref:neuroligin-1-like isoform X2 n=1 Tax=Chelonus insularis TaxID=460826 RepID=UPI0015889203|nr:neuroligin-1-like isoform X2 [Chelonus insularis]
MRTRPSCTILWGKKKPQHRKPILEREGVPRAKTRHASLLFIALGFLYAMQLCHALASPGSQQQLKYSPRQVRTRYGTLRGIVARSMSVEGVEVYLGVPYATPPVGALRYMPPIIPNQWRGTRLADTLPPACPQKIPGSETNLSRRKRAYIERITPLLANQSEDCLYLNLYVPRPPHGFLKTGTKGSTQGNYGLMDLVAGLHWLRENVEAFGGDPERLSILGLGTGAALANFLAVSPMAKELVERVILLGGSALSPWAIQRDPITIKRHVAEQTGCLGDVESDDITVCLRLRDIKELLNVHLDTPRFTSGFAPFVDGTVLPLASFQIVQPTTTSAGILPLFPGPGSEFAALGNRDLLLGLTSCEAWLDISEDDLKNGINSTRRDRILRTFVRNTYRYHLHEIYSTLKNEYTDWEKDEQSPNVIKEGLLSLLGDGQVAAPLLRLALLHSSSGGRGYFFHFQPGDHSSQRGEELPYLLGIPLLRNEPNRYSSPTNYTPEEESLSRMLVRYLSNFVRRGDPNGGGVGEDFIKGQPFWDSYDSINQLYLEVSRSPEMRSHYRGHKMSLWLNLLPQLHRPGYEISMRHHHLAESPSLYEGAVRPQSMALPLPPPPLSVPTPTEASISLKPIESTECSPNITVMPISTISPQLIRPSQQPHPKLSPGSNNLLRKFATNHYQSYTTALTVTIAVGIFLLLLNILIFAGIYHQRDRNAAAAAAVAAGSSSSSMSMGYAEHKKKERLLEAGCSGIDAISVSGKHSRLSSFVLSDSSISSSPSSHKHKLAEELELQLQEFQCSPPPGGKRMSLDPPSYAISKSPGFIRSRTPSPCVDVAAQNNQLEAHDRGIAEDDDEDDFLPDPPPPPKVPAPNVCSGILRQPGTPGSAKKRVQIQEISVC